MNDSGLSFPDAPRAELDRQLDRMIAQVTEELGKQQRIRSLLSGYEWLASSPNVTDLVQRVQALATELVGARSATVELVGILGYYVMISMTLNVFRMMPPADAELAFAER